MADISYWHDEYHKETDELMAIMTTLKANVESNQVPKFNLADTKVTRIRY